MSSEADNHMDKPDETVDGENATNQYEPSYSEPTYGTPDQDTDWTVPASAEGGMQAASPASAPDASPLMDGQVGGAHGEQHQGAYWNEGAPVSGETANSRLAPPAREPVDSGVPQDPFGGQGSTQPPHAQNPYGQQPPGQQAQWGSAPQQPYQSGPPTGGMPPQQYYGGPMSMSPGQNNPYYLAGPSEPGRGTLQLDYWLSAFFWWVPALIFYLTEKDKNKLVDDHTKELLNFNLTRLIVVVIMFIPLIGTILGGIASIVLFVIAIMGALKGPDEYAAGRTYQFPLAIRFIR